MALESIICFILSKKLLEDNHQHYAVPHKLYYNLPNIKCPASNADVVIDCCMAQNDVGDCF